MRKRWLHARRLSERFLMGALSALEFECALLEAGFYNIEFNPPTAVFDGVRYPLMEMKYAQSV